MEQILKASELKTMGFEIGTNVPDKQIDLAIAEVEACYLSKWLGRGVYNTFLAGGYPALLERVKLASGELAFANLMYKNPKVTRSGAVVKNDAYSIKSSSDNVATAARCKQIARELIAEVAALLLEQGVEIQPEKERQILADSFF